MQRFYKPVLLRWRHPQKQGDSFPDWWLLNGRHQNGLGHPNLNRIGIYVKWDGYSLGWQKHGFARVDLIAFHVRSAEVLRDGLGGKLCLTDVPKISRQVYGLTCRQDQMRIRWLTQHMTAPQRWVTVGSIGLEMTQNGITKRIISCLSWDESRWIDYLFCGRQWSHCMSLMSLCSWRRLTVP